MPEDKKKKVKETIDNEAKPGKDDLPKAVPDPNEDKSKSEPKLTSEPEMNKVVKEKIIDKTDDKEPNGDLIDPHIQNLEKDIKKTMDMVSQLENNFAVSVDSKTFQEIIDFIDNFGNLREAPEDEIPEDIPEVDEVDDENEDEDEIEITATGDDEIQVDTGEEDETTQAVVTVDMPSDVEPEDVNVNVDVDKKYDMEPEVPEEEPTDLEIPEDIGNDDNMDVDDNVDVDDIDIDNMDVDDEEELLDNLNKFVNNILNEIDENIDDEEEEEIPEEDAEEDAEQTIDELITDLGENIFKEKKNDLLFALDNYIKHLDNVIKEEVKEKEKKTKDKETQMEKAKKNVEDKFKAPDSEKSKEKKEDTLKENVQSKSEFELLPIAENASWSPVLANKRVIENVTKEDTTFDFDMLKKAYLYVEEGHENDVDAYQYQIADVINGQLFAIPKAIHKMSELFANDLTLRSLRVKEEVINEVRSKLEKYLEKMGEEIPWNSNNEGGSIKFQEANGLLSIYTAYEQFDPSKIISKLQEKENRK